MVVSTPALASLAAGRRPCRFTRRTPGSGQTRPGALLQETSSPGRSASPAPLLLPATPLPPGGQSGTLQQWVPAPGHTMTTAVCSATQTPSSLAASRPGTGVINRPRPVSKVLKLGARRLV